MPYEQLVSNGSLKPYKAAKTEIMQLLKIAARDILAARRNLNDDPDWAFNMSYNALLQASRALLFNEGYRTRGGEAHVTVIEFMREKMGSAYSSQINQFDQMRRKRHRLVYETSGIVSKTEAQLNIDFCERFIKDIESLIVTQPNLGI